MAVAAARHQLDPEDFAAAAKAAAQLSHNAKKTDPIVIRTREFILYEGLGLTATEFFAEVADGLGAHGSQL